MLKDIAILLRNTTWKCGKVERLIVDYLQQQLQICGRAQTSIKEMMEYFKLKGKQKNEIFEAIRRLERRHIIKIVSSRFRSPSEPNVLSSQGGL